MADITDLVKIARGQIGTEEDENHQNKGSSIEKYQACTGISGQGWPWCAAFVDWCVQQFADEAGTNITHVPRTTAAFGLITWGNDNHYQVFNPPASSKDAKAMPGDIVVYEFSIRVSFLAPGTLSTIFMLSKGTQIRAADVTAM